MVRYAWVVAGYYKQTALIERFSGLPLLPAYQSSLQSVDIDFFNKKRLPIALQILAL